MSVFKLTDLNKLAGDCREAYKKLPNQSDVKLEGKLKNHLEQQLNMHLNSSGDGKIEISPYSISFVNKDNLIAIFPSKWLWTASIFYEYGQECSKYFEVFREIKKNLKLDDKVLKNYPKVEEPPSKTTEDFDIETEALKILHTKDPLNSSDNFELFKKFLYKKQWWNFENEGRKLDRPDAYNSTVLAACQFIAASSDKLISIIKSFENSLELRREFASYINKVTTAKLIKSSSLAPHINAGENIIYYGAPGTGKSHEIDQNTDANNSVRTVFHPETQYSDFVGSLKPSMGDDGIEYSFKHGPFIEALVRALNDPDHHYYLIIEEINRAPAAAVFGDLFQLLDRDSDGQSKYKIDVNDKDLLTLLNNELASPLSGNKLYIPKNLSLYATMNSSDQAVMPLDTAFKRRWKFEYKPLDFLKCPIGSFELNTDDGVKSVSWSSFALIVNSILSMDSIPEDRHLGPWFVSKNEIADPENARKALTGKILMYLWDDVLRHSERSILFQPDIRTFGSLVKKINAGEIIFSETFLEKLKKPELKDPEQKSSEENSGED